ncbi:MAG: IS66 family insertion sequence element accessory protein TnpB [Ferruginibacter sp.]
MLHLSPATRYYLYTGHTDMRKGFDSLCGIVSSLMAFDALSGAVFVFINKKRNQVKLLLWEGDGLSLYYKRLEKGTYERPANNENITSTALTYQQLQFILQGVALQKIRYRSRYQKNP